MNIEGNRFLVVGGGGFIGSHVVRALLAESAKEVVVYDDFSRGRRENLPSDPRLTVYPDGGNILDRDTLRTAMVGVEGVFHLAAKWLLHCHEFPESAYRTNVEGTWNVIDAAIETNVPRLVFSSSASVYGNAIAEPMTEEHPLLNTTLYGATKIAGEAFLQSRGRPRGQLTPKTWQPLSWCALRYMNVYGPGQDDRGAYASVIPKTIARLRAGEPMQIHGDGTQTFDFVHVEDVARANVLAMQSSAVGFYNVSTGRGTSLNELALLFGEIFGRLEVERVPSDARAAVTRRIGSTQAAKQDLGFEARIGIRAGLRGLAG